MAQGRQRLGADRFDQAFASGSGLSQREAVAAARARRGLGRAWPMIPGSRVVPSP